MTELVEARRSEAILPRATLWTGLAVVAGLLLVLGYAVGDAGSGTHWREGTAHVGQHQASIVVDDWEYGISDSVTWIDRGGSHHEEGWPRCLDVAAGTSVESVRFAWVDVEADGASWREVVLVDCQEDP